MLTSWVNNGENLVWSSRDLALVIILAAYAVVYSALIYQTGRIIVGIPGINYILVIGQAIWIGLASIIFEGKRWRLFLTAILMVILTIPTYTMGPAFNIYTRIPAIINAIFADILINSIYPFLKRGKKLVIFCIISAILFIFLDFIIRVITYPFLLFSEGYVAAYIGLTILLSPVIIIESIIGGYIAYLIYNRIKNWEFAKIKTNK